MEKIYDIAVIGGGPAGLTAALYGLRNGKKVVIIEKSVFGGQIVNSPKVENIPGFETISGDEYGDLLLNQVTKQGCEIMFDEVKSIDSDGVLVTITMDMSEPVTSRTAIIATGTVHRTLGLPYEEELIGKGIHFCAVCDGSFYKDKTVVMVGGGNSAFVEAEHLVDIVGKLIMLQDLPFYTAEQKLQDRVLAKDNIEKHVNTKVKEYIVDNEKLTGIKYEENGELKQLECDGVFLAVGLVPQNDIFTAVADVDERGYFIADESGKTKTGNIFVAGDCREKTLRQVATACSDGANAAIAACNSLK